jgi:hypothetical protein
MSRQRLGTVFGWIAGGCFGLLLNYFVFLAIGSTWLVASTFLLFVAGAFAGMYVADRLGDRAFRVMGVAAGILFAIAIALGAAMLLSTPA